MRTTEGPYPGGMVRLGPWNYRRREGRTQDLDPNSCNNLTGLSMETRSSDRGGCVRGVPKGGPQTNRPYHIFVIPRLFSPRWIRLLYKLANFLFHIPPGSPHWPCSAHECFFVGILLLLLNRHLWTLRRTPLLVGLEPQLREVQVTGESNGGDILCKLLRTPWRLASMSEGVSTQSAMAAWGESSQ
jgi:hypothetical protein